MIDKKIDNQMVQLLKQIKDCHISDEEYLDCTDLTSLGYDSIDLMQLAVVCEDTFKISFEDENLKFEILNDCVKIRNLITDKVMLKDM